MYQRQAVERKEIYDSLQDEMGGLGGAFVVDLEQSAHASTPGAIAPSMNTHSEHYSYESKRLAIDEEYLLMQGVDAHPRFRGSCGEGPLVASFKGLGLSYNEYRLLAGNGIHVPVFAAWFLFSMGYIRRREVPTVEKSLGDAEVAETAAATSDDDFEVPRTPSAKSSSYATTPRPESSESATSASASASAAPSAGLAWHPECAALGAAWQGFLFNPETGDDDDEGTQLPE